MLVECTMVFHPGDIIIKLDTRGYLTTKDTRQHVMLVLGETSEGYPEVLHMTFHHQGLQKEILQRGRDLVLLHHPWSMTCRKSIVDAAETALQSGKFVIDEKLIEEQLKNISSYNPDCSYDAPQKLSALQSLYREKDIEKFSITPSTETRISCHEWVVSIIHYACHMTKTPVPITFKIPPALAWSDRILAAAQNDDSVTITYDPSIKNGSSSSHIISALKQQLPVGAQQTNDQPAPKSEKSRSNSLWKFFDSLVADAAPYLADMDGINYGTFRGLQFR